MERNQKGNGAMRKFWWNLIVAVSLLGVFTPAWGQEAVEVIVDNWPAPQGEKGVPEGWELKEYQGKVEPGDITILTEGSKKILQLRAEQKSFFLGRRKLSVSMEKSPILTWRWKIQAVLADADARDFYTDDQPINIYVTFKKGGKGNLRAIGYLWDNKAPRCSYLIAPAERPWWSRKALRIAGVPITWYVILQNGESPVHIWFTESRNLAEDYKQIFGTDYAPDVHSIAVQIDTSTLGGSGQSWVGSIRLSDKPENEPGARKSPCKSLKKDS